MVSTPLFGSQVAMAGIQAGIQYDWVSQFGGAGNDWAMSMFVQNGSTIITASIGPTSNGGNGTPAHGDVRAYSSSGDPLWSTSFGSSLQWQPNDSSSLALAVATDSAGSYFGGYAYNGTESPHLNGIDAFVQRVDAAGRPLWNRSIRTEGEDFVEGLDDFGGTLFAVGAVGGNLSGAGSAGMIDAFVQAYGMDGTLLWSRQFGTPGDDYAIAVRANATLIAVVGSSGGSLRATNSTIGLFVRWYDWNGTEIRTDQWDIPTGWQPTDVAWASDALFISGYDYSSINNLENSQAWLRKITVAGEREWAVEIPRAHAYSVAVDASRVYLAGEQLRPGAGGGPGWTPGNLFLAEYSLDGVTLMEPAELDANISGISRIAASGGALFVAGTSTGSIGGAAFLGGTDAFVARVVSLLGLDFEVTPDSGLAPLAISYHAAAQGGTAPYRFFLEFGDGNNSSAASGNRTFGVAGTYAVALTVTDSNGLTTTHAIIVHVIASPPTPPPTTPPTNVEVTPFGVPWYLLLLAIVAVAAGATIARRALRTRLPP